MFPLHDLHWHAGGGLLDGLSLELGGEGITILLAPMAPARASAAQCVRPASARCGHSTGVGAAPGRSV
jgi:hypothetical protein